MHLQTKAALKPAGTICLAFPVAAMELGKDGLLGQNQASSDTDLAKARAKMISSSLSDISYNKLLNR